MLIAHISGKIYAWLCSFCSKLNLVSSQNCFQSKVFSVYNYRFVLFHCLQSISAGLRRLILQPYHLELLPTASVTVMLNGQSHWLCWKLLGKTPLFCLKIFTFYQGTWNVCKIFWHNYIYFTFIVITNILQVDFLVSWIIIATTKDQTSCAFLHFTPVLGLLSF